MKNDQNQESRNLTLESREHREIEALAKEVAHEFRSCCSKLRNLRPKIERIRGYFAEHVRGSVTVLNCSSFKEYCEQRLGRTKQAVYSMLGEYPQRQQRRKKKVVKPDQPRPLDLHEQDVIRMRDGLNAVHRARQAESKGEKDVAAAAWREYETISEAAPIRSRIEGDHPNLQMIVADLLGFVEQQQDLNQRLLVVIEKLPPSIMPKTLPAEIRKSITQATQVLAIRKRLGLSQVVQ